MKSGYLIKQGFKIKSWKKRWFLLSNSLISYFKTPRDMKPISSFYIRDCKVSTCVVEGRKNTFYIETPKRTFYLAAETEGEMQSWLDSLKKY